MEWNNSLQENILEFFIIQLKLSVQNGVMTEDQALKILDDRLNVMEGMEPDVQKDDGTWDDKKVNARIAMLLSEIERFEEQLKETNQEEPKQQKAKRTWYKEILISIYIIIKILKEL